MKSLANLKSLLWVLLIGSLVIACEEEEEEEPPVPVNETPIAPTSTNGRPNKYLGCVEISNRNVDIEVWDHGTVDGDIISLIVNRESGGEETILNRHELDGPSSSYTMQHSFAGNGYNYLTLYAHNEGSISPNTATISIDGNDFTLSSNLDENGYVDIVVTGYGVDCSNSSGGSGGGGSGGSGGGGSGGGGSGGGGSGGGGGTSEGDLTIWTQSDLGCGYIDVTLNGDTERMTHYYSSGNPGCGATGCANYSDLDYGTYSYSATSNDGCTWSGSVSIDEDCTTIEFTL